MPNKLMKWFRIVGFVEGLSLILLLFVAMPLKYMLDMPTAVTIVGSIHGGLFILYMVMVAIVTLVVRWSFKWIAGATVVAFVPFGNIVLDRRLRRFKPGSTNKPM